MSTHPDIYYNTISFLWLHSLKSVFLTGCAWPFRRHQFIEHTLKQNGHLYTSRTTTTRLKIQALTFAKGCPLDISQFATSILDSPVVVSSLCDFLDVGPFVPEVLSAFLHTISQQDSVLTHGTKTNEFSSRFQSFKRKYQNTDSCLHRILAITHLVLFDVSVWPCHLFHHLDVLFRVARNKNEPFGGVPVLFEGDWNRVPPMVARFGNMLSTSLFESMVADRVVDIADMHGGSNMEVFWRHLWKYDDEREVVGDLEYQDRVKRLFATSLVDPHASRITSSSSSSSSYTNNNTFSSGTPLHLYESKDKVTASQKQLFDDFSGDVYALDTVQWQWKVRMEYLHEDPLFLSPDGLPIPLTTASGGYMAFKKAFLHYFKGQLGGWTLPIAGWKRNMPVRYVPSGPPIWPLRYGMWGTLIDVRTTTKQAIVLFSNNVEMVVPMETRHLKHPKFEFVQVSLLPLAAAFACSAFDMQQSTAFLTGAMHLHYWNGMTLDHGRLYSIMTLVDDIQQIKWCGQKYHLEFTGTQR
ncbi:unnamed protein product [Sphagnum jensenii]|uniref:Uncharacterized protein n=1 Tax=Sphagnum jensenii TaxID=128206 RepID=A0ABP0VCD8_9BRYO